MICFVTHFSPCIRDARAITSGAQPAPHARTSHSSSKEAYRLNLVSNTDTAAQVMFACLHHSATADQQWLLGPGRIQQAASPSVRTAAPPLAKSRPLQRVAQALRHSCHHARQASHHVKQKERRRRRRRRRASDKHRRPTANLGKQAASRRRNLRMNCQHQRGV